MSQKLSSPRVRVIAAVLLAGIATFIYVFAISGHLMVFSEARYVTLWPFDLDVARFFLFPELAHGHGRLSTMAVFAGAGQVCGVGSACVNVTGALLISVAASLMVLHTHQITKSLVAAAGVTALWVLSPAVLSLSLWQSTWFDSLAIIGALAASAFWWDAFGRRHISRGAAVGFVVASVLLIAFAFNAKEITYYLAGVLVILAVYRGYAVGQWRRNLLLAAIPLGYAVFFMGYALLNIDPAYASQVGGASFERMAARLARVGAGLGPGFMGIYQVSTAWSELQAVAKAGYLAVFAGAALAGVMLLRRPRPSWSVATLMSLGPELYLLAILTVTFVVDARSARADAYYLVIPYWAGLALGALLVLRLAARGVSQRILALVLVALFTASALTAYASHFSDRSAWVGLSDASSRMRDVGSSVRELLDERPVNTVSWQTIGKPIGRQYVLRAIGRTTVGREIWPWLVQDAHERPEVVALENGTASELRGSAALYDAPGQVLLVLSEDYRLQLLAYEGEVLFDGT